MAASFCEKSLFLPLSAKSINWDASMTFCTHQWELFSIKGWCSPPRHFFWWISPTNPSDCLCFCQGFIIGSSFPFEHHCRNRWNLVWDLLRYRFWMAFFWAGYWVLGGWGSVWIHQPKEFGYYWDSYPSYQLPSLQWRRRRWGNVIKSNKMKSTWMCTMPSFCLFGSIRLWSLSIFGDLDVFHCWPKGLPLDCHS